MKKLVCLVLCVLLLLAEPFSALARDFSSAIQSVHSTFVSSNTRAKSSPQQSVNGAYRCVELLVLIALQVGVPSSTVNSIHSTFVSSNNRADSAPQQEVNGLYRCVELLEAIAYALN